MYTCGSPQVCRWFRLLKRGGVTKCKLPLCRLQEVQKCKNAKCRMQEKENLNSRIQKALLDGSHKSPRKIWVAGFAWTKQKLSWYIPNLTWVLTNETIQQRCSELFIKRINYWFQKEDFLPVVFGTNNYVWWEIFMTKKMRVEEGEKMTGKWRFHFGGFFKCLSPKMSLFLWSPQVLLGQMLG